MTLPQTVICKKCSNMLYEGLELKPAEEIVQQFGGFCPKCGSKLVFNMQNVEIAPVN